ncbi:hypothetical protein GGI11_002560 [Coemansia sp. RSA 2049]|nr:hypothetical protein GGI11_002560 [Coemansia sp. RSA 2049]KAJ2688824.1 hypothetical protein GGH99_002961 [Coemansia sp. RSA 1285]
MVDAWDGSLTSSPLGRMPTERSDCYLHSQQQVPRTSSATSNSSSTSSTSNSNGDYGTRIEQTPYIISSLPSDDLGPMPLPMASADTIAVPWAVNIGQQQQPQRPSQTTLPLLPSISTPSVSVSLSEPLEPLLSTATVDSHLSSHSTVKRRRTSTNATKASAAHYIDPTAAEKTPSAPVNFSTSCSDTAAQKHNDPPPRSAVSTLFPDAYVQLELQRVELERQRLALDQERWREERAERMRWEQMYRDQWQEEREERRAFRDREMQVWRTLLALTNASDK